MIAVVLTLASAGVTSAEAAPVTVSGTVLCPAGAPVVGVWVQSTGGGSRFAKRAPATGASTMSTYSARVNSGAVKLHVGCGGTPANWASDQWTPRVTVSKSRTMNAICKGKAGTGRVSCSFPANPGRAAPTTNGFAKGNCTKYAADKWRTASQVASCGVTGLAGTSHRSRAATSLPFASAWSSRTRLIDSFER
jgi:hypothetical protein